MLTTELGSSLTYSGSLFAAHVPRKIRTPCSTHVGDQLRFELGGLVSDQPSMMFCDAIAGGWSPALPHQAQARYATDGRGRSREHGHVQASGPVL
jgi:hypothetical protein